MTNILVFLRRLRNKNRETRESLEENGSVQERGGERMVKGVSKRMIVVPSPDPEIFEQAIFIVREDFVGERGLTDRDILRQARQAVKGYARPGCSRGGRIWLRLEAPLYAAAGAVTAALAWMAVHAAGLLG